MSYVDGFVAAVPAANKDAYIAYAKKSAPLFTDLGATAVVENWGDDIPDGKQTDFKRSVQAGADEVVVFSWIVWPDKATRDAAWAKMMEDNSMSPGDMPFDGKRLIYGGFSTILEA